MSANAETLQAAGGKESVMTGNFAGRNPYQQYKQTQVQTASQGHLILMMYAGAVRFLHQAKDAIQAQDTNTAHTSIIKVQDIVTELMVTLNPAAGEIAQNLRLLYDYMYRRLITANIRKDPAILDEVEQLLTGLQAAWEEIIKNGKGVPSGGGGVDYGR